MIATYALETRNIRKRFGQVLANDEVNFNLRQGEIHAVVGENGAGKSTLMNIICGLYSAEAGDILIDGEKAAIQRPRDAIRLGIAMVHQHFMLVPNLTAAENIMLGAELTLGGFIDRARAIRQIGKLSETYGLVIDPAAFIEDLPVGLQQRVEIIKALYRRTKILVLDEPTAVLTPPEVEDLFRVMRRLTSRNVAIIFISHKLKEAITIADRISVMRRGKLIQTTTPAETSESALAEIMVGRDVSQQFARKVVCAGEVVLDVRNLTVADDRKLEAVRNVSLQIMAGEILGVAGVQGNGQTELAAALSGLRDVRSGTLRLGQRTLPFLDPRALVEAGVAHIPEDRLKHGLVLQYSIADNQVLNTYYRRPFSRYLHRNFRAVHAHSRQLIQQFDIRAGGSWEAVGTLSGGNQQKVIVSRELGRDIRLLIANQPTRGLDVGAIAYVHRQLLAMRDRGVAVLLISVELDEILALSDRIAVMFAGQIVATFLPDQVTKERLGLAMIGATPA